MSLKRPDSVGVGQKMMNDSLTKLAYEVDDFIALMIEKHGVDPLILGSCMLARLTLINEHVGSGDDFRQLMLNIPKIKPNKVDTVH